MASKKKSSITKEPESLKLAINEDNKEQDLRNKLIAKARLKNAMLKIKKVQSKIEIFAPHEKIRSISPKRKTSDDKSRSSLRDRSYEDERLGLRNSEDLKSYPDERRSRSKERLVRDGRPKKKKSNLVDPYLRRAINKEKLKSPEKRESSMERCFRENSARNNLVFDLERRRADDAYIDKVRERVNNKQSRDDDKHSDRRSNR